MAEKGVQERWRESGCKELKRCIKELYKNTMQYIEWVYFIEEKWRRKKGDRIWERNTEMEWDKNKENKVWKKKKTWRRN